MIGWLWLSASIALEIMATSVLKLTDGFTKIHWVIFVLGGYGLSFYCMSHSLQTIPLSVMYAIWCGVGILAISLISLIFYAEPFTLLKTIFIAMIAGGVVGLTLITEQTE